MISRRVIVLSVVVVILILSNFHSGCINAFTGGLGKSHFFQTEEAEFQFCTMPAKGRDLEMIQDQFATFQKENPEYSTLQLQRTFKRNPLQFWNWYSYCTDDIYDFEHQDLILL